MIADASSIERRQLSRGLRQKQAAAESLLWKLLRGHRQSGLKFRRQHPLGQFMADFYCSKYKLAIEIDGGIHKQTAEHDLARDKAISQHYVRVIRFKNEDVLNHPEIILEQVKRLTLNPSPRNVERDGEARERHNSRAEVKHGRR